MGNDRSTAVKVFVILFLICVICISLSFVSSYSLSGKELADTCDLPIGETLFAGDSVLSSDTNIRVPFLAHPSFLIHEISSMDLQGILISLTTGAVSYDLSTVSSEGIDMNGRAYGFDGPGHLVIDGDKIAVKSPDNCVWGYGYSYKVLTKTDTGVNVVENKTIVDTISEDQIKNSGFNTKYYNESTISDWYKSAKVGDNFTLEKGLNHFSDNRSDIAPKDVTKFFGNDTYDYMMRYNPGCPVTVYMANSTENYSEDSYTQLGSFPEYGDSIRAYNAKQFCEAWNNTIIPPNSSSTGQAGYHFDVASDSEAPGGGASHGVCPPGRALRGAILSEGFSLPAGMSMESESILYGYSPTEDIWVHNPLSVPVKVVMWYDGDGASMVLHCKLVKYVPN